VVSAAVTLSATDLAGILSRIPDHGRRFSVSAEHAQRFYRIDGGLLAELMAADLPALQTADGPLFDDYDLTNVSLCLHRRSPQRAAMRYWATVLNRPAAEERRYEIAYVATCPVPGHPGPCRFLCCLPGDEESVVGRHGGGSGDRPLVTTTVRLENNWPLLPAPLVEEIRAIADVGFYRMPEAFRWDTGLMMRERIADCAAFARHLVERGRERGLRMRPVLGLIVAAPYSTPHFWAEVEVAGRWVPADPGLVRGLRQWGVLDFDWPADRSPGALLARLSTQHSFLASHRGVAAHVAFPTRLSP
jgi:hypothetical protein